jgi:hypothetical protein
VDGEAHETQAEKHQTQAQSGVGVQEPILANRFGTVYPDRVMLNAKRVSLAHRGVLMWHCVTYRSSRCQRHHIMLGFLLLLPILTIPISILFFWGFPSVVVAAGGGRIEAIGMPWAKSEAEAMATAVRSQLFT